MVNSSRSSAPPAAPIAIAKFGSPLSTSMEGVFATTSVALSLASLSLLRFELKLARVPLETVELELANMLALEANVDGVGVLGDLVVVVLVNCGVVVDDDDHDALGGRLHVVEVGPLVDLEVEVTAVVFGVNSGSET